MNRSDPSRVKIRYAGSIDIQDSSKKSVLKAKAIFDYSNPLLSLERKKPSIELDKQINKTNKSLKEKHVRQYKISFAYTCTSGDNSEIINPQITNLQRLDKMTTNSDHQFVADKLKPVMSRIVHRLIQEYKKSKSNQNEEKEEKSLTNAYTFSISASENPLKDAIKTDKFSSFSNSISPYLVNSYTSKSNTDKNYEESVYPSVENLKLIKSNSTIKGSKTFIKHNTIKQIKRIQKYHSSYKLDSLNTEFGKNESYEIVCCGTKNFIHPKLVKDTFLFKKIKIIQSENLDLKKLIKKPSITINEIANMNSFDRINILDLILTYSSLTYNTCTKDVFRIHLENLISYRRNIHFSQFVVVENTTYYEAETISFTNFICIVADLENWSNFRKLSSVYDSNLSNDEKDSSIKSEIKSRGSTISFSKKKKNPFGNRVSIGSQDMFERTNTSRRLSKVERVSILQRLSLNAKSSMTFLEEESVSSEFSVLSDCPICHGDPIICLEAEGRKSLIEDYVTLLQESDGIEVQRKPDGSIDMKDLKMLLYNFMAKNDTYPSEKIKEEMIKRQESMMRKLEEEEELKNLGNHDDNEGVRSILILSKPEIPKGEGKNPNLPQQFLKSLTKKVDEFKSPKSNGKKSKLNVSPQSPTLRKSESFVEIIKKTIIKSENDNDSESIDYTNHEGIKNLLPREHHATTKDISSNVKEVVEYMDSDDKSSKQDYLKPKDTLPSKSTTENSVLRTGGKNKISNFDKAATIVKEWLLNIQPILKEIEHIKLKEIPLDVLQNSIATSPVSKGELFIATNDDEGHHFLPITSSTISQKRPIVIHSVTNPKNTELISDSYTSPTDENIKQNQSDQTNKNDLDNIRENKDDKQLKNQLIEKERNGKLNKLKEESTTAENISNIPKSVNIDKISKTSIANKTENKNKTGSMSTENDNKKINQRNQIKAEPRKSLMKESLTQSQNDKIKSDTKNGVKAEPRKSLDKNMLTPKESKENVTNSKNDLVDDRKIVITKTDISANENKGPIYYEKSKELNNDDQFVNESIYVEIETKQNNEETKPNRDSYKETIQIISPVSSSSNSHEKRISTFDASISQVLHEPLEENISTDNSSSTRSQATSDDLSAKYTNESPELKKLFNKISWENSQSLLNLLKFSKSNDIFENGLPIKLQFSETKSNKSSNVKHVSSSFKGSFNELNKKNENESDMILPDLTSPDFNDKNKSKSLNKSVTNDGYHQPGVRHITDPLNRNLDIHHLGDQINGLPESLQVKNHLNYQTGNRQISDLTNQQLKDFHDNESMYRYADGIHQNVQRSDNLHYQITKPILGDSPNAKLNLTQGSGFPNNQLTNQQIIDRRFLSTDINQTMDPQNRQLDIHQFSNHRVNVPYSPEQSHIRSDMHQKSDILNHQNDVRGIYYPSDANNIQMEFRHLTDPMTSHYRTPITHNVEEFSSQKLKYQGDDFNISRYQPSSSNKEIDDLLEKLKSILSKSEEFLQILSSFFSNIPRNSNTINDTVNIPKDFYLLLKSICENKENEQENHVNNESFNEKALNKICKMLGLIDDKEMKKNKRSIENFNDPFDKKKNNEVNKFFKDLIDEGKSISEEIESNTYSLDINESFINKVVRCVLKKLMETNPIIFKEENNPSSQDEISLRNTFLSPPKKENRKSSLNDMKYFDQTLENETDRKSNNSKMKGDNKFDDYHKKSIGKTRKSMNIAAIIEDFLPNESKNIINGKSMEKKTLNSLVVCDEIANRMKNLLTEVKQSNKIIRSNSPKDLQIPKTSIVKLNQTENLNLNPKDSKMFRSLSANCLNSSIINPNPFASRHTVASIQNIVSTPYQKQKMNSGTRNIRKEINDKSTRMFLNSKTRLNNNMMITNCNKNENNRIQTKSLTRNSNRKMIFK